MVMHRAILEMGSGNDLHGSNYTKAAFRALQDAMHHSSLSFIKTLGLNKDELKIEVTIGVQSPHKIDVDQIKKSLPFGSITVKVVLGGLDVLDEENGEKIVIASAAIEVYIEDRYSNA